MKKDAHRGIRGKAMREKYQKPFKVVIKQIQGKSLSVAMAMLTDEMTLRVKKTKKREKIRDKRAQK